MPDSEAPRNARQITFNFSLLLQAPPAGCAIWLSVRSSHERTQAYLIPQLNTKLHKLLHYEYKN